MFYFFDSSSKFAACLGMFVFCGLMATALQSSAIEVDLGNLSQVYDGGPKVPDVASNPPGLAVDLVYRELTSPPAPVSEVVFNNVPNALAISYSSLSFTTQQVSGFGNYLRLAGNARKLEACDVTLVTWAKAATYPTWETANSQGYNHPVRLSLYRVTETNQLVYLTEIEQSVFVPWRPLTLPNGDPYPPTTNGYAFNATFVFPTGITLPEKVLAMVSYNTQSTGFAPIGVPGPYNELNLALGSSATPVTVGSDADPGAVLKVVYSTAVPAGVWEFPNTSLSVREIPLIRLRALSSVTKAAPVNAGNYEISGSISDSSFAGGVLGVMAINKAQASIKIDNLSQFYTGGERPVTVTTTPSGLPVTTEYAGSGVPPTALGVYAVSAQVIHPNYLGAASAQLTVIPSFKSWMGEKVSLGVIPAGQTGDLDDPDADGISNLMEYALNLDPAVAFGGASGLLPLLPSLQPDSGEWTFTYRRNPDAADVSFVIEHRQDLAGPGGWSAIVGTEKILSDDGNTQVIEVSLPVPPGGGNQFYRLGVSR